MKIFEYSKIITFIVLCKVITTALAWTPCRRCGLGSDFLIIIWVRVYKAQWQVMRNTYAYFGYLLLLTIET